MNDVVREVLIFAAFGEDQLGAPLHLHANTVIPQG
jgi:hypothetical protein